MFYIHHTTCISAQQTFGKIDLEDLKKSVNNELCALEPVYNAIPPGMLRRMGKAVRFGVGTGLSLLQGKKVDGIIIGTANGGLEDCVKFLIQIIEFEEGRLTPTNFVQSTTNAVASSLGLMSANKGYNVTHVHRGLSFENAVLDTAMLLSENSDHSYLLGGLDEISSYNNTIEKLGKWYKESPVSNTDLYNTKSTGSLAGEGASMFLVSKNIDGAIAKVMGLKMLHTTDIDEVVKGLQTFIKPYLKEGVTIDLLISGENGDERHLPFYEAVENELSDDVSIIRYKHMSGEYPTSSAFALWLSSQIFGQENLPQHLFKRKTNSGFKTILVYNHFKGAQHSFMLVSHANL